MTVSMDDVAARAGVSKSTVSLVLNNRSGTSEEMRTRVLEAAQEVGYQLPGQRARPGESSPLTAAPVIALVHCVDEASNIDPGLTQLYLAYRNGIQRFTHGRDISIMLVTSYRDGVVDSLSYQLLAQEERTFDGFILMGPGLRRSSHLIQRALDQQIPTVILGRSWPDIPISSVSQDHFEQAVLIMDHLLSLGHERIGFVARNVDRAYDWFEWRLKAYREAIESKLGSNADALTAIADGVPAAVDQLLAGQARVTAIFGLNDHVAYEVMASLRSKKYDVPKDISVVGIDGVYKLQEGLPRLTTVTFPHEEVGFLAAELLLKQFENHNLRNARLTVRSHLISGDSCAEPGV